ncbi:MULTISPECIES: MFS transporter [Buttiauxella]|jgi:oligogalacturonide transporter|uniref:Rhamnogalacturonide transporter n=1 Tax=Buttiauxella ferragutiae ATCC 51602 TaxID=1354252 RepID=A0ABX2W6S0_9ENTR|nr:MULTISPECIES: MFS transporter [Buttiauxella]AYN26455.1 MFS transporter [Buttiauxella sp. 3AFRM03]MCE0827620.1 MFS transporter [Buttiauxella ferragutiae]OAT26639.1 rhamnogalacturonide transporter [Buttiauxella ferragutiae ATCC 51602]TDN54733.1 oligogalacturonide transporter [Buttiauxella sp. JUb87]UNK63306.1 MFS transporter [Buttiauxella ferragutiae]
MKTRKIGLANYLAYGSGDFLGAGTTALTAAWLLYFYTTFCGLTPIEATFIFALARVLDAVVSPLMGFLTDNFGSTWLGKRFGRRKFFILLGIPLVFSYSFMWVGEMSYWYYLVTYLIFDVVYTMILVPYETLVPEMTDDFKQKTKFSGARISMAQLSAILAAFLPGILLSHFGKDNAISFFYSSLVFASICAIVLTLVWFFTWERPRSEWTEAALRAEEEKKNLTFAQSMKRLNVELTSTLRVKIFRQHLGMYLGGYIAQDVFNAVFTYYVVFVLMQSAAMASSLMGTMAILQFVAVIGMIPLCIKYGPAPSYRLVVTLFGMSSISFAVLYYAGLSDVFSLLLLVSALAGLGRGGINYVPWNIYTYIADVDEVITGQRREGIFAGIMTLTRKASQAGAVMLVGIVMQFSGFVSGQTTQPPAVSHTILMILSFGTVAVLICGFLISLRFKLNMQTHSVLREETAKMREAGRAVPEAITPEARATVELLAGMPYDSLWGNNNIGYLNRNKPAAPSLKKASALNSNTSQRLS